MIDVRDVIFEYPGKRALKDVSFQIASGSITALVGPNGAGKTTLLRCLSALDEPFSGTITINEIDVIEHPRLIHQKVGYLSDFFGLYNTLTVRQCLIYIAQIHRIPEADLEAKVMLAANRLEIAKYLDIKAGTLSRGLRQRLGIAQAILHEPQILLLDEPASGLDPEARMNLSDLFLRLQAQGMTLIVSSHILAELEDYCTDMLLLRDGRILEHCVTHKEDLDTAQQEHQVLIKLLDFQEHYLDMLNKIETIQQVTVRRNAIECVVVGNEQTLHWVLKTIITREMPVCGFIVQKKRLQDIYMDYAQGEKAGDISK